MNRFTLRFLVVTCVFLFTIIKFSTATHLMGGNISYAYLGLDSASGNYQYRIMINIYRLCDPGSSTLPTSMNLGAYQDDPGNPTGDKLLIFNTTIPLISIQPVSPPNAGDSCTFAPNVCVEEGYYEAIIQVPPSTNGYYFISDRCCRNNNIANLDTPGQAGQAYFAFAPSPTIVNSSPTFAVLPVPFICNTDTASVLNQAFDPDGDLLIYQFVVPYNGVSAGGNPNPNPPVTYPWPVPPVTYAPTYSLIDPFGPTGYAAIDTLTGLASYYSPNQGFYVLAVEIKEYRNGVLIGISRRDIQIIVITCPPNPAPVLSSSTSQTSYTIQEGDSLCFTITFNDPNGDSLHLVSNGPIFDSLVTNPAATFIATSGQGISTGQFCWATSCDQGNNIPYQFSIIGTDEGCPAKVTNIAYTIPVINTPTPGTIIGPDTLCLNNLNNLIYSVPPLPGYTFSWNVSNGTINGASNNDSVNVSFNGNSPAILSVFAINSNGCESDTIITKEVILSPLPTAFAGSNIDYCSGSSSGLGGASTPGYTYSWSPATGLSNTNTSNPTVTLINTGSAPVTTTYILTVSANGCTNTDTVTVTSNPLPAPSAGPDVFLCSGSQATIGTTTIAGNTYSWSPSTGLSSTTISDPVVTISSTVPDTISYFVTVTNIYGCSTTDSMNVVVGPVPVSSAGNDTIFCSGSSALIGTLSTPGYSYSWSPSTGLNNSSSSNPTVTLINSGTQNDTLYYTVTTSLGSCSSNDLVQIIVKPNPVANAGTNQLLCAGNTIQLGTSSTSGYTYLWSPAAGLNNNTISNPTLTLNNTGTLPDTLNYVVTVTLNGCISYDTVSVISGPVPAAIAGPDTVFCSGSNVSIGSAQVTNVTYNWSPASGLSSGTISNPNVTLTNSTANPITQQFILTTNLFGCTNQDSINVTINPNPVSEAGLNATLCGGDTLQLGTTSTSGYIYSWSPGTGLNSTIISNPVLVVTNNGSNPVTSVYTVTTTLNGCVTTDSVIITINPLPVVTATSTPSSICLGDSATLTGNGATVYTWYLSTNPGTAIGTGSPFVVSPTVTSTYLINGANSFGCDNSSSVTVTVNPLPVIQINQSAILFCEGDTITLTATGATNYVWSVLGGSTIGTGTSIQVSPAVNTTYVVVGTDGNLCSNSDSISVTVNPTPVISAINGVLSVCPGVSGVSYWINNPNSSSVYTWTVTGGTLISGQGTDSITVDWPTNSGAGTVSVTETNTFGCVSEPAFVPVTVNVLLTPVAPVGATTLCANEAQGIIYSTLNTPGSTYIWNAQGGNVISGNGTNIVSVDWTVTGPQIVALWYDETSITAVDTCFGTSDTLYIQINPAPNTSSISGPPGICINDSASFSVVATGGSSYSWNVSNGTLVSGDGTPTIIASVSGTGNAVISVVETNVYGCVGDTVFYNAIIYPLPAANAGPDAGVCLGQSLQLNATGGVSYQWSPPTGLSNVNISNPIANPVTTTTYTVLVTDVNGCRNTDQVEITVYSLPVVTVTPDSPICIGGSIQLNASGGTSYQWSPATGLNNPAIGNPVANPVVSTTYSVSVTDANGCVDSSQVTITVNPLPQITAGTDTTICDGTNAYLQAFGGVSYSWTPAGSLNNSQISNPVATPSGTTTYTVTGTDANGCTNTSQVTINTNINPQASFIVDDSQLAEATCAGYNGQLTNTSINSTGYVWQFADGSTSTEVSPTVQLALTGTNPIILIAYNNMCTDTFSVDFTSTAMNQIFANMPNVFTPNDDGINDCFTFRDEFNLAECSSWDVLNRWGRVVFSASSSQACWNGKKNNSGEELPSGSYYIIIRVNEFSYKGTVTLFR